MDVLTDMTEGLRAFAQKYDRSISDPKLRRLYELDLSARRDERAIVKSARAEGRAEGMAEGEARGEKKTQIETAKRLLQMNMTPDFVREATGLSLSEVQSLEK